ncbi:MAG: site-specific integrase [Pseudomonadota bacterium]
MGVWKDKAAGTWKFKFQMDGKVYGGGGHKNKKAAISAREQRKLQVKQDLTSGSGKQTPTDTGFREAASRYLDFSARRHAPKTYAYKAYVYDAFIKHAGDLPITQIVPGVVQGYLTTRKTNSNYNRHRKDLGAMFSFTRKTLQLIQHNPCDVIERLPEERFVKKIPTQEEFLKLMVAAGPDERPLITVLAHTMARIDEILRLRWVDVNFEKGFLILYTRKTNDGAYRGRDIPLNADLKSTLKSLWDKRTQDEWVFLNPATGTRFNRRPKFMRGICKRAGIPDYGFHAIRHFISSYLFDKEKVGKATIGKLLGHQSPSTTDIYLHSLDDSLKGAMQKLEGSFLNIEAEKVPATGGGNETKEQQKSTSLADRLSEMIEKTY